MTVSTPSKLKATRIIPNHNTARLQEYSTSISIRGLQLQSNYQTRAISAFTGNNSKTTVGIVKSLHTVIGQYGQAQT